MAASLRRHFRILDDIARDLSGDVVFPTCMDAAILIRDTLKDPEANITQVVQAVSLEPLISSKLLRLANSAKFNPRGHPILDLGTAIGRLGFEIVRTTSLATALDQMLKSRKLAQYANISRQTWEYSLQVAAIARVLAHHLGRVAPDNAMLAGMVHNIGAFYLLHRAADYPEYCDDEANLIELIASAHAGIGESLLHLLGIPAHICTAVRDQHQLENIAIPCSLSDILYFAKQLAELPEWQTERQSADDIALRAAHRSTYRDLLNEATSEIEELQAALSA